MKLDYARRKIPAQTITGLRHSAIPIFKRIPANCDQLTLDLRHCFALGGLDGHKAHARLLHRQPDRAGVGHVGLVAQHKGAHRLGVQQANRMTQDHQCSGPVVRTPAGLHGNQA